MGMNPVLKKLHLQEKEFVTSEEIKEYCNIFNYNYYNTVRNLTYRGYLLRIFKGIFYLKSFEELKFGKTKYSYLELVSRGLELKGVANWYFGLFTALKLNNVTHEHFTLEHVISDKIFRNKPIKIVGYQFKFIKLKGELLNFGINKNKYRYSDIDKTILDFIYIWRYNGKPKEKIIIDVSEYKDYINTKKILYYSNYYPKSIRNMMEDII